MTCGIRRKRGERYTAQRNSRRRWERRDGWDERWDRCNKEMRKIYLFSLYFFHSLYNISLIPERENAALPRCGVKKKDFLSACNNWHCSVKRAAEKGRDKECECNWGLGLHCCIVLLRVDVGLLEQRPETIHIWYNGKILPDSSNGIDFCDYSIGHTCMTRYRILSA